ncbi:MAG: glutamyl-tRNA reductase [Candidatus Omnitrophica bacterium]|nr:glutamyl-tRNA reductase [Candidatus Omnitrophota bacterium]
MKLTVVGINYRSAPIELREKLAFSEDSITQALTRLKQDERIKEAVILSTCNRVEIYSLTTKETKFFEVITEFLSSFHKIPNSEFEVNLYKYSGPAVIRHLFRVISSLDSQVLGENQILGQVKGAYLEAKKRGTASRYLSFVFEDAIKIGKRVRSQTEIGFGAVSLSTAAVQMAKKIFGELSGRKILVIGAGKIGELTLKHLHEKGARTIFVTNRTLEKSKTLAKAFGANYLEFADFSNSLEEVDIVISSLDISEYVITKKFLKEIMQKRRQKPIFFIDLGLPRNIDPQINVMDNAYVYNLDDLKKVKDANFKERFQQVKNIELIIEKELVKTQARLKDFFNNE